MSGEIVGKFIVGLLKGKEKKDKEEKKRQKAIDDAQKKEKTEKVNHWKNQAARFDNNSPAKDYALSMVAFYSDGSNTMTEPTMSSEVRDAIYGGSSPADEAVSTDVSTETKDEGFVVPAKYDPTSEKNIKAKHIKMAMTRWFNSQSDEFRASHPNWVPSFETILGDINRFEGVLSEVKGERDSVMKQLSLEKTEMTAAEQNKENYSKELAKSIDLLLDEMSLAEFKLHETDAGAYDRYLEQLANSRAAAGGKVPTTPIDNAGMNRLIELLSLYQRLTGNKYKRHDEFWHKKIGLAVSGQESGRVDVTDEDEELVLAERKVDATTTLADMYGISVFQDIKKQENFRANSEEYFAGKYPEVYDMIDIYNKESSDYDAINLKLHEIDTKLTQYYDTVFMRDWSANHDFAPIIDDRKKITDDREFIQNPTFGKEIKNENIGKMIPNPEYSEEAANAAIANGTPYNISPEIIDERKFIMDERERIKNPNRGQEIDNPNQGHPLPFGNINPSGKYFGAKGTDILSGLGYPYYQEDEDKNK